MTALFQDIRYALRQIRNKPGFAAIVIATLALGIGATTAMFSLVDGALFRSLPYPHADELVSVGVMAPIIDGEFLFASNFLQWRHEQKPFSAFASSTGVNDCDLTDDHPLRLTCAAVDSAFLPTFEIQPILGRNFTPEEDRPNAARAVLLSYGLWQSRFAGDRGVINRTISLDGKPTRVIGVLPRDFEFPTLAHTSAIIPEALDEAMVQRNELGPVVRVYARMKPGLGLESAAAQLGPLFREFVNSAPPEFRKTLRLQVRSLRDLQIHKSRLAAWFLLLAAITVLLISCANAAGLVLARGTARRHEIAVRVALGATRMRIFRHRLTESALFGFIGGAFGCVLAWAIVHAFVAIAPAGIPHLIQASIDGRVLIFAIMLSAVAGVIFGAAPALERPNLETLVATTAVGRRTARMQQAILIGQVALTLVLLAGASLFLRSLRNLENRPLGLNTQHVVIAQITLGQGRYPQAVQRLAFFEQLEGRLKLLPGLSVTALSDSLPPMEPARTMPFIALQAEGEPPLTADQGIGGIVGWRSVTPGYFSALGIPVVRGRAFTQQDRGPGAIILNQILANRLFPNQDPLGKTIRFRLDDQHYSAAVAVVGVAANTENKGLGGRVAPEYYMVRRDTPDDLIFRLPDSERISIIARSPFDAGTVSRELNDAVAALDPSIPVQTTTLSETVYMLAQRSRFSAVLLSLFAVMAALLAAVGIYGLVSLLVSQSTQEIAIRITLGAGPGAVTRQMISHACNCIGIGVIAGVLCVLAVSRWVTALLFGIKPTDPISLAAAGMALLLVGLIAAYVPARRAAKVDPMVALRYE